MPHLPCPHDLASLPGPARTVKHVAIVTCNTPAGAGSAPTTNSLLVVDAAAGVAVELAAADLKRAVEGGQGIGEPRGRNIRCAGGARTEHEARRLPPGAGARGGTGAGRDREGSRAWRRPPSRRRTRRRSASGGCARPWRRVSSTPSSTWPSRPTGAASPATRSASRTAPSSSSSAGRAGRPPPRANPRPASSGRAAGPQGRAPSPAHRQPGRGRPRAGPRRREGACRVGEAHRRPRLQAAPGA